MDLAGSERIAKTLTEGHKFEETILINTSLTALGKVNNQSMVFLQYNSAF